LEPEPHTIHCANVCLHAFVFGVAAFWFWNVAACYTVSVSLCVWHFRRYMAVFVVSRQIASNVPMHTIAGTQMHSTQLTSRCQSTITNTTFKVNHTSYECFTVRNRLPDNRTTHAQPMNQCGMPRPRGRDLFENCTHNTLPTHQRHKHTLPTGPYY
jgi:hypothetical protein